MTTRNNNIILGLKADLIRICIVTNILIISLFCLINPLKGIKALKRVREKRQTIQGLPRVKKFIKEAGRYFFSENIPGWPSSAFNGFVRAEIMRASGNETIRMPLMTVIIAITSRCRLGCEHCYEWNNIAQEDKLSPEDLKTIIKKIKNYGINHIQLSGGEPLERFDELKDLLIFTRGKIDLWLLTSGYGLTFDKALALKKAGLTGADISLDHWNEIEHNRSRKSSKSFYWVKEAVNNCRKAGIATSLSLCAFRSFVSYDNMMKYADLAKELGVGFIRILEPREAGKFLGKDIALGKDQIVLLEEFYQSFNKSEKFASYPIITYIGYHQRRVGCFGAGNRYFYIDSAGEIHACPFCQRSAGNAVSDSLEDAISLLSSFGCQKFKVNLNG